MASKEAWGGYILEEVLAYLIKGTGYTLLVDPCQDPRELVYSGGGIAVRGRGGIHQADVLGQLSWVPAFTFPLRLFVEAKFRKTNIQLPAVRHAVAIVLDINQNTYPVFENQLPLQRNHYSYALFSKSGFHINAVKMALAHEISLIDLSGPDFQSLIQAVDEAANNLANSPNARGKGAVINMRNYLRHRFSLWPADVPYVFRDDYIFNNALMKVIQTAEEYGELFVAMANGPFMLVIKAFDRIRFINYCIDKPIHRVTITYGLEDNKTWFIQPTDNENAYRLSFRVPVLMADWISDSGPDPRVQALVAKKKFLSSLSIYRLDGDTTQIFKLVYDPESTKRLAIEIRRRNR
jgi:hypothetical protein